MFSNQERVRPICILPKKFQPKFKLTPWIEEKFKEEYLKGLDYRKVNASKRCGQDYVLDLDALHNSLPKVSESQIFLFLIVPSPCGVRFPDGVMFTHANTILIDPKKKEIRVNEPKVGTKKENGDDIEFSPEVIKILKEKYPDYTIVDEKWKLQETGETICGYLALKAAQHYYKEIPENLTREYIVSNWTSDMRFFIPDTHHHASTKENFDILTTHLAAKFISKTRTYIETIISSKDESSILRSHLFDLIYDNFHAFSLESFKTLSSDSMSEFKLGILQFSNLFDYLDSTGFECNILSPDGEKFIECLWLVYKKYFDTIISTIEFCPSMTKEELDHKLDKFNNENSISSDEAHKEALIDVFQSCLDVEFNTSQYKFIR